VNSSYGVEGSVMWYIIWIHSVFSLSWCRCHISIILLCWIYYKLGGCFSVLICKLNNVLNMSRDVLLIIEIYICVLFVWPLRVSWLDSSWTHTMTTEWQDNKRMMICKVSERKKQWFNGFIVCNLPLITQENNEIRHWW
jgi:hypothetical protein